MSLLLRPPTSERIQTLTLVASFAVARGIKNATSLKVRLRWPNDVMIEDKKVAGVIAESSYRGQELSFATVGIGVNCNSKVPSADSWSPATNLAEELGRKLDIVTLRNSILEAFGAAYEEWLGGKDVVESTRSSIGTLGKHVVIATRSGETIEGKARDINSEGSLVVEQSGKKFTLHAEDVERLRET
jgi:BirA family biotin operon repressor/biotin-[acetyl-CoA-carboxylase] ligase